MLHNDLALYCQFACHCVNGCCGVYYSDSGLIFRRVRLTGDFGQGEANWVGSKLLEIFEQVSPVAKHFRYNVHRASGRAA